MGQKEAWIVIFGFFFISALIALCTWVAGHIAGGLLATSLVASFAFLLSNMDI